MRAVLRELRGNRSWEKTAHVGAHRPEPTAVDLDRWIGMSDRTA
jgi:hypothetical protein